jgi:hypothetical protein
VSSIVIVLLRFISVVWSCTPAVGVCCLLFSFSYATADCISYLTKMVTLSSNITFVFAVDYFSFIPWLTT